MILIVVLPCILISMNFFVQQMHYLLKQKILQFVFKCLNVHFSAPSCFGPPGPSLGSIIRTLLKLLKLHFFKISVKTPR
jgi:hypothetical protein